MKNKISEASAYLVAVNIQEITLLTWLRDGKITASEYVKISGGQLEHYDGLKQAIKE